MLQAALEKWKKFSLLLGTLVSKALLTAIYCSVMLPWGLCVTLFSDPLGVKGKAAGGGWRERKRAAGRLEDFLRQH